MNRLITTRWLLLLSLLLAGATGLAAGEDDAFPRLGLEQALAEALASHRDAERARLALQEARLDRLESRLRLAPRLSLQLVAPSMLDTRNEIWIGQGDSARLVRVDWQQRRDSGTLLLSGESPLGTTLEAGADVWHRSSETGSFDEEYGRTYRFGLRQDLLPRRTLWGDLQESEREADQAELEALEALAEFRHRAAGQFLDVLRAQQGLELARQDGGVSRANWERAQARFAAGLIAESDYLKVELEDLQLQAAFQSDSLALSLQERDLARLLGRSAPLPRLDENLSAAPGPPAREELERALEESNAGLARRRLEQIKLRRELRGKRLERLPELNLNLDWSWNEEQAEWSWRGDEPGLDRSLSLVLDWPLFTGGERTRAVRRAELALRRGELSLAELRESLVSALDRLWLEVEEQRLQAPLLERQLELATQDARISQERFQAGQITSQQLIDAERALSQARLRRLDLGIQVARTRLDLARLSGADRAEVRAELEQPQPERRNPASQRERP